MVSKKSLYLLVLLSAICNILFAQLNYTVTRTTGNTFTSIASTGTTFASWRNGNLTDDNLSVSTNIGFNFTYDGAVRTTFSVGTNGFITFNTGTTATGGGTGAYSYLNTSFAPSASSTLCLAPLYDDLVTVGNPGTAAGLAAAMRYQLTGTAPNRVLTVQWTGMEVYANAGPDLNFQVKLYETTNVIEFWYGTMTPSTAVYTYTCGINGATVAATPTATQLVTQQTVNTATFSATPQNALATVPVAGSKIIFTPTAGGPANDLVCNATAIACGGTAAGTTVGATNSGTGENSTCTIAQSQPGVWYVVPGNGQIMTASLCATAWDSKISVFSGTSCATLTCIGGVDDNGPACTGTSASYSWTSVSGTNYYILVHGYSTNSAFSLSLTCTAATPPPCTTYLTPANAATGIDPANMTLTWNASAGATSYDIYFGTAAAPVYFTNVAGTSISITGGITNTAYYWRIVPRNANGVLTTCTTVWSYTTGNSTNMPNFTNGAVYTCNANFYDSGGNAATYGVSENRTITYYPATAGQSIQMIFSQFDMEANYEYLRFYDGTSTLAPQITTLPTTGTQNPAPVLSATNANGAITVNFTSDISINYNGWAAAVSCCAPPTSPAAGTFGSNVWNVYCYKGNNLDLAGVTYKGYYVEPLMSYDSQNRWATNNTPSSASGYQGCAVELDYHTVVSKRQGFTPGYYSLSIPFHDDDIRVYVNGTVVYTHIGCCDAHGCFWSGYLDGSSTIEVRHLDGVGGSQQSLTFTQLVDPATYGNNQWNIYNYTANFGVNVGYATNTTTSEFNLGAFGMGVTSNPASLSGYLGCNPGDDNWAMRARRQGFPCGVYNVSLAGYDDNYTIAIDFDGNGSTDYSNSGTCCNNGTGVLWTGVLNSNSKVELTLVEGGGDAYLDVDFNLITPTLNGGTIAGISDGVTICYNTDPGDFLASGAASGGIVGYTNGGSYSYTWESSITNSTTNFSTISGQTGQTYNPGNLTATTWFRRKVIDNCGNIAYSNVIQVTILQYASGGTIATVSACSGGTATVTISGASNVTNYAWTLPSGFSGTSTSSSILVTAASVSSNTNFTISAIPQNISGGTTCAGSVVNGTITVNANLTPSVSISASSTNVCAGTSVTFTATATNGGSSTTYQWSLNGSSVGSNSSTYSSSALVNGDVVTCTITANNTCQTTATATSNPITMTITPQPSWYADTDGDGYGAGTATQACTQPVGYVSSNTDCNNSNNAVYPGATEICNGVDDDCDGSTDEDVQTTYYVDADGDGFGSASGTTLACSVPSGYSSTSNDCNDSNNGIYPGATEICDGIDQDCDGTADDGLTFINYYADTDGDGFGAGTATSACSQPTGYVTSNTDCNNSDNTIYPGATEICNGIDDDCDGSTDEGVQTTFYVDADGDGFGSASGTTLACSVPSGYSSTSNDCNDANNAIYPGATETCNTVDDDCDGSIDEGVQTTYYVDADGDGYGSNSTTALGCTPPTGYVVSATDCDDSDNSLNPGATEVCDGIDQDCDGTADDGLTFINYYADGDGDGFGTGTANSLCADPGLGYSTLNTDCEDTNEDIYPGATEVCNSVDDDCDGQVDEGLTYMNYYVDQDGDGYGSGATTLFCSNPGGNYTLAGGDCNELDNSVYPNAPELCNGIDDDCDTAVDEGALVTYYFDGDNDGYGVSSNTVQACTPPTGYTALSGDCFDASPVINPAATETCNGLDDNCDGIIDNATVTYYSDADGDGFGSTNLITALGCTPPTGYVGNSSDCNDANANAYPGATEVCNGADDDCDASIDEGVLNTYFADVDGDGFGSTTTISGCSAPTGYVSNSTDCDDSNIGANPGATELCNNIDDDCDGTTDEGCPSTTPGEEPYNAIAAPSSYYAYCSNFYGTLADAVTSTYAQSTCITGEDKWYTFTALSSGITIYIGSYFNDILIELQDANGNLVETENAVNGIGTEVLNYVGLTPGMGYRVGVRNFNSNLAAGNQFSGCIRHLKRGGCDSGTAGGGNWPGSIGMCSLFKASYAGSGVQYRYTWTGLTGIAAGNVYTRTQSSDYLNLTNVVPRLPSGCQYNVLVTNIFTIPNGAGVNEVLEISALSPCPITILADPPVQLRTSDQCANGPRFRSSVVASLPWVCGVNNWRWRFTEVNPATFQTIGLPIEVNRGAASNYINLGTVTALQWGKTYAVQTAPVFTYTGSNYQWGPVQYLCIIGQSGMILNNESSNQGDEGRNDFGIANDFDIALYPNPTNGEELNVILSGVSEDDVASVRIMNTLGQMVYQGQWTSESIRQKQLNVIEWSNGMYVIEVRANGQTMTKRFMISR